MSSESRAAFARRMGVNKGTVTRWAQSGRLVLAEDGGVHIDESIARLDLTSAGRTDVAARHAAQRGAVLPRVQQGLDLGAAGRVAPGVASDATDATLSEPGNRVLYKAEVLRYENETIKLERALRTGVRYEQADVRREALGIGALVRAAVERLIDQTAPRLAVTSDAAERRRLLAREVVQLKRMVRRELPRALRRMRKTGMERKAA